MLTNILPLIDEGYIMCQKHPTADLWIYNYTTKCQYEKVWNETTLQCRGLILNKSGNIVARPFGKFFNIEEHDPSEIPNLPFEVFEKMDGSLGILYWLEDKPYIASRGAFASEQAQKANEMLYSKYAHLISGLSKGTTYIFEIIYPENRIVVDYEGKEELFLIAVFDNKTGKEQVLQNIGFPMPRRYDGITDFQTLKSRDTPNAEGFVLRFSNGFRVKVKFEECLRLHRLMTQFSNVSIWENLMNGTPIDELLERVPDEFYDWVKAVKADLENQYKAIEKECKSVFITYGTRKETALYFQAQKYPGILFLMLDGKDYSKHIWRMVRPVFGKPFKGER